jgi:uncharacterized membrane protein
MDQKLRILFAGESWISHRTHLKQPKKEAAIA